MKTFKDVEKTRQAYHKSKQHNSVHRSSLLVPNLQGTEATISFLNHFLIKRNYRHIACCVTAIDEQGSKIQSVMTDVNEAKIYSINLRELESNAHNYLVEFFASENLFIPFPAVMINHYNDNFFNIVHAYNRILNSPFEDSEINSNHVSEAGIGVRIDDDYDTFFLLSSGIQPVQGEIIISLHCEDQMYQKSLPCELARMSHKMFRVGEIFPHFSGKNATLKILQPKQFMFYGRVLTGQIKKTGEFGANHSYYDCSEFPEYWDNAEPSTGLYPFFKGLDPILRFDPIISPGTYRISIGFHDAKGQILKKGQVASIKTPGNASANILIHHVLSQWSIEADDVSSFSVEVSPLSGTTPTRVNHQLIYGKGQLEASINVSLDNPNVFLPKSKTSFKWGQIPVQEDIDCYLGIVNLSRAGTFPCKISFYGEEGLHAQETFEIAPFGSETYYFDHDNDQATKVRRNSWFVVESSSPNIQAFIVTCHKNTHHCSGEHSF